MAATVRFLATTNMDKLKCDNCGREGDEDAFKDAADILQRHSMGDTFSDKECPDCGALAFPVPAEPKEGSLRQSIVAIIEDGGEGLLDDHGVDHKVAVQMADAILLEIPKFQEPEEPTAFGFGIGDICGQANCIGLKLTRLEAVLVLSTLLSKGNASIGVNWGTIGHYILHCKVGTKLTAAEKRLHEAYQIIKAK